MKHVFNTKGAARFELLNHTKRISIRIGKRKLSAKRHLSGSYKDFVTEVTEEVSPFGNTPHQNESSIHYYQSPNLPLRIQ